MNFDLHEAMEILERTPRTLEYFLSGISVNWLNCNEGGDTWNSFEVINHLIEAEKQNWLPRLEFILKKGEGQAFPPFDRFAHLKDTDTQSSIEEKLHAFKTIRAENLVKLQSLINSDKNTLEKTGFHPAFGTVKVRELISTWAVHDLTHISQITRIFAERYRQDVGPWKEYLGILK
ncbi:DinB family protein [Sediminibacillus massiliensis]|uniref:DinB family protein n=1 Tax=Sediminibacillus massiliensis TaxID=1926277 RepID=UPI000988592D|nr:DinB family protein [Sediminibacillus massiliensis]